MPQKVRGQVGQLNVVAAANHRRPLDHAFQLKIIARPQIQTELGHNFIIHPKAALEVLFQRAQMVPNQQRNIADALAQRRDLDFKGLQTIKQLAAEAVLLHQQRQIGGAGGDDAHVHRDHPAGIQAHHDAGFQHLQQRGLHVRRQVFDLIQIQRTAVGQLEFAQQACLFFAGVAAQQFAQPLSFRQQLAVERNIRPGGALAGVVDGLAEQLFAYSFLAAQQQRMVAFRRLLAVADQTAHFQRSRRHLFKGMADAAELAADVLMHPLQRVQQRDKPTALPVGNRL